MKDDVSGNIKDLKIRKSPDFDIITHKLLKHLYHHYQRNLVNSLFDLEYEIITPKVDKIFQSQKIPGR